MAHREDSERAVEAIGSVHHAVAADAVSEEAGKFAVEGIARFGIPREELQRSLHAALHGRWEVADHLRDMRRDLDLQV